MIDYHQSALSIIAGRIKRETEAFEERESGKPFLPNPADTRMPQMFIEYCQDIERVLELQPSDQSITSTKLACYHLNYMFIPTDGIVINSEKKSEHRLPRSGTAATKSALDELLEDLSGFVENGDCALIDRPSNPPELPIMIDLPLLLVLYVGGHLARGSGRANSSDGNAFHVEAALFGPDQLANKASLDRFRALSNKSPPDAYVSLHYTFVKTANAETSDPIPNAPRDSISLDEAGSGRLLVSTQPGRAALEAATLHFQRQWGDREAEMLKQAKIDNHITHNLCHDLYAALRLLDGPGDTVDALTSSSASRFRAAQENIKSCLAAPWLMRYRSKSGPKPSIWQPDARPSEEEIRALFRAFDRKLLIAASATPPPHYPVAVCRRNTNGGIDLDNTLEFTLGSDPSFIPDIPETEHLDWPLAPSATKVEEEGAKSLLFSPYYEAVRNALLATEEMELETAKKGVAICISIAKDASYIEGTVSNGLNDGEGIESFKTELREKLENMSLNCRVDVRNENQTMIVGWKITFGMGGI